MTWTGPGSGDLAMQQRSSWRETFEMGSASA
jgi:hypothetical protein